MTALPDGNAGKALALGMAIVIAAAVYFAIVTPVLALYGSNAALLEQQRDMVRRYENAIADLPRLRDVARDDEDQGDTGAVLLAGTSDAIAAAELQSTLKDFVESEGSRITSAATLPPADESDFRRVAVRIAFTGDIESFTAVLQSIETAMPVLAVGNFEIRATGGEGEENPDLAIVLEVSGYRAK